MSSNAELVREVMSWAEERLHEELSVPLLAARAGYSIHHFTRLFAAQAGLSPSEWLQARRVAKAASLLAGGAKVSDAAAECGFSDTTTFARAFRRETGLSPSAYRGGARPAEPPRAVPPPSEPTGGAASGVIASCRLERLPRLELVGLAAEVGPDPALPGRLWARLEPEARAAGILPPRPEYYQLARWDDSPASSFTCLVAFLAPGATPPPLPFSATATPAARCLVCVVPGSPAAIPAAYAELYTRILPGRSERPSGSWVLERYPEAGVTELCVPLEK
ncbi:MAG: AraC family transcriptional regulator [Spirochaetaceae bacterium]|nr:AraC family transcriptional regulator [Spirochaetaceae bacterium]